MNETATLKVAIDAAQAATATKQLDGLAAAAKRADTAVAGLQGAARGTNTALTTTAGATATAARSMNASLTGAASAGIGSFMRLNAASMASRAAMATTFSSIVAGAGTIAKTFIPGGLLVTAVGFGLAKVVEMFTKTRDEMRKTQEEFTDRMNAMQKAGNAAGLTQQAFGIQQERNTLATTLAGLRGPGTTVGQQLNSRSQQRELQKQIAEKDAQIATIMQSALAIPDQYVSRSNVFGVTTTADTAEFTARAAARESAAAARAGRSGATNAQQAMLDRLAAAGNAIERLAGAQFAREAIAEGKTDGVRGTSGAKNATDASMRNSEKSAGSMAGLSEQARQAEALFQSLADGMQRTLAGAFAGLFRNGIRSAGDFARQMRDLLINAFSEVLASRAMGALLGNVSSLAGSGGSISSGGGGIGALLGVAGLGGLRGGGDGGKLANINKGSGNTLGGGLLAGLGGFSVGSALGQRFGTGGGVLGGAAAGAALGTIVPGIGNVVGAVVGGLAGAIGGLFGGAARKKSRELEKQAVDAARQEFERGRQSEFDAEAGVYLAPAGFNVNGFRFNAGRPTSQVFTGGITITVPEGTTERQARSMLDQFATMQLAQGLESTALPRGRN
jgi:hypothetical protein